MNFAQILPRAECLKVKGMGITGSIICASGEFLRLQTLMTRRKHHNEKNKVDDLFCCTIFHLSVYTQIMKTVVYMLLTRMT